MKEIKLFPTKETGFGKFLVEERIIPFIKMQILINYLDSEFEVSYDVSFANKYSDEVKEFGKVNIEKKLQEENYLTLI